MCRHVHDYYLPSESMFALLLAGPALGIPMCFSGLLAPWPDMPEHLQTPLAWADADCAWKRGLTLLQWLRVEVLRKGCAIQGDPGKQKKPEMATPGKLKGELSRTPAVLES